MADMELILTNSVRYNGQDSSFTQKAETLLQVCKESLAEVCSVLFVSSTFRFEFNNFTLNIRNNSSMSGI